MVVLKSSDGETFVVEGAVVLQFGALRHMFDDICEDNIIPLDNVTSNILDKVIQYCKHHVEATPETSTRTVHEQDLNTFDVEFLKVDQATLFDLISAANYLNIKSLIDLTCDAVADMIRGKTPEEIRKTFNISNGFTPEEEEEVRRENQRAFD